MPSLIDLTGERFGRLVAVERGPNNGRRTRWVCRCDCGSTKLVGGEQLHGGHTRSCGCLSHDVLIQRNTVHGQSKSPAYLSWCSMIARCDNPNNPQYNDYGGRGVRICQRWRDSFADFATDMGERPIATSLDRIDNNGDYEPGNCRWATRTQQARNKRTNRLIALDGVQRSMAEWSEITGLRRECIRGRLNRGWTVAQALAPATGLTRRPVLTAADAPRLLTGDQR